MVHRRGLASTRLYRARSGARFGFAILMMMTTACGGVGKTPAEMPSGKEFFLRRDTPVDSVRVTTTEAEVNASIPPGEVEGIVVDGYWGDPVPSAQVVYRDARHPEESIGVITDGDGHFHLKRLPARSIVIRASRIGDLPDTVRIDASAGHFVRFGLRRQGFTSCGLIVQTGAPQERPFAIAVFARDARTGRAPSVPITITLRDGRFADSATVASPAGSADSILVGAARGRDGVYDVEVTAGGYKAWHLERVRPVVSECTGVIGRVFPAWLIPTQ